MVLFANVRATCFGGSGFFIRSACRVEVILIFQPACMRSVAFALYDTYCFQPFYGINNKQGWRRQLPPKFYLVKKLSKYNRVQEFHPF